MWVTTFLNDTEVSGVGTVIASINGLNYSRRVDTNSAKDVDAFVTEAKENFGREDKTKTDVMAIEEAISAALNKV